MPSPNDPSGTPGRRLPWRGIVVLVVVVLVGLLPLARHLLDRRDELLATNTRAPTSPQAATLRPKAITCSTVQRDELLEIPEGTRAVRVFPAYATPGEAPQLSVEAVGGKTRLRGRSSTSYPAGQPLVINLDAAAPRALRQVCVRNLGGRTVTLARAVDVQGRDRALNVGEDASKTSRDLVRFDFLGRRDALAVSLVGGGLENAGAYKPDGVSPLLIGAGLVLVLLGAGGAVLLVARAPEDDEPVVGRRTTVAGGTPPARGPGPDGGAAPVAGSHERTERGGW